MLKLVEISDFLGFSYSIKINSQTHYKSILGGLLSFLIIVLSAIMVFILGLEIFFKNEPIVLNGIIQNDNFGPYNFSNNTNQIQFFVGIQDANWNYFYDESIYTVEAIESKTEYVTNTNGTISQNYFTRNIKLGRCSEFYTVDDITKFNLNFPLELFTCMDPNEDVEIIGFWGRQLLKTFSVKFNRCENSTESNVICQSKDAINNLLENGVFSLYTSDYIIDQKNYTTPTKKFFRDVWNYLSTTNGLIYIIAYADFKFQTDIGLLFQNYDEINIPMISDVKNSFSFRQNINFAIVTFQGFDLAQKYLRSYSKIQDILTKVGGLVKALTLIGLTINYVFSKPFVLINNILENHNIVNIKKKIKTNKIFDIKDVNSSVLPGLINDNVEKIVIDNNLKIRKKNILSNNNLSLKQNNIFKNNNIIKSVDSKKNNKYSKLDLLKSF